MAAALVAMALLLTPVANADAKVDARTPARELVATLTSPFETGVVWHESEAVILDESAAVTVRAEDTYVTVSNTPIRLRVGFSGRVVEAVHARF